MKEGPEIRRFNSAWKEASHPQRRGQFLGAGVSSCPNRASSTSTPYEWEYSSTGWEKTSTTALKKLLADRPKGLGHMGKRLAYEPGGRVF